MMTINCQSRLGVVLAGWLVVSCCGGCQMFSKFGINTKRLPSSPVALNGSSSKEQIISVVNANANRVNQLDTQVKISVPGMPPVSGDLAVQQPNRMRLQAGVIGTNGIDVGSNEQGFWVWQKVALGGQRPAMYYARHEDYARSQARQAIPVDPKFLMDSLGIASFSNQMIHDGPYRRTDGKLEIRSRSDAQGRGPMRTTVVDEKYGHVLEQHTFENGRLTASSYSSEYRFYPNQQVSLPQKIEIRAMPGTAQELNMTIEASPFNVNNMYGDPIALFSMPDAGGARMIDISRGGPARNPQRQLTTYPNQNFQSPNFSQQPQRRSGGLLGIFNRGRR